MFRFAQHDRIRGRGRRETWTVASLLLAARDFAFLHSTGCGRDLFEPADAARRRNLSMGKARLQRVHRIYRRLESLAAVDHGHRVGRNVYDYEPILRHRSGRYMDAEQ